MDLITERMWDLCLDCAENVFPSKPYPSHYTRSVAALLQMTWLHESGGGRYRRQGGFSTDSTRGAFSIFQIEKCSLQDSLLWLGKHPDALERTEQWIKRDTKSWYPHLWRMVEDLEIPTDRLKFPCLLLPDFLDMLLALQDPVGDRTAAAFARIHYLRVPKRVPSFNGLDSVKEMAEYAKKYYNTKAGKAHWTDYALAFAWNWPVGGFD